MLGPRPDGSKNSKFPTSIRTTELSPRARNCAWNLAFPAFISPIVWNMCENLPYESVYFK